MKLLVSLLAASAQAAARDEITCDAGYELEPVNKTECLDINECNNGSCLGNGSENYSKKNREISTIK